jgi:hypothetical protein
MKHENLKKVYAQIKALLTERDRLRLLASQKTL